MLDISSFLANRSGWNGQLTENVTGWWLLQRVWNQSVSAAKDNYRVRSLCKLACYVGSHSYGWFNPKYMLEGLTFNMSSSVLKIVNISIFLVVINSVIIVESYYYKDDFTQYRQKITPRLFDKKNTNARQLFYQDIPHTVAANSYRPPTSVYILTSYIFGGGGVPFCLFVFWKCCLWGF